MPRVAHCWSVFYHSSRETNENFTYEQHARALQLAASGSDEEHAVPGTTAMFRGVYVHMDGEGLDKTYTHLWVCSNSGVSTCQRVAMANILIGQMFSQMRTSGYHCFWFVSEAVQFKVLRHTSSRAGQRSQGSLPHPYLSHHSQSLGLSVSYFPGS